MESSIPEQLFLNSTTTCQLHNDPTLKTSVVQCLPFVAERLESRTVVFRHSMNIGPEWPLTTDRCCLHDGEPFTTQPVPCVTYENERKGEYEVYGLHCGGSCAKAYMEEHEPHISTQRLMSFYKMMREVFGVTESIRSAPPRCMLAKYGGGTMTIEEFRKNSPQCKLVIRRPPFVRCPIVVEQRSNTAASFDILAIRDDAPSLYTAFLKEQETNPMPPPPPQPEKIKKKAAKCKDAPRARAPPRKKLAAENAIKPAPKPRAPAKPKEPKAPPKPRLSHKAKKDPVPTA
jgi:hypothetical protein